MILQKLLDILLMILQVHFEDEHVLLDIKLQFQLICNTREKHEM